MLEPPLHVLHSLTIKKYLISIIIILHNSLSLSLQLIGWRQNARHLLLYITDAGFHYAGDGKVHTIID